MYLWHTNIYPAAPFDTQIHIDPNGDIYKYDAATTTWNRYFGAQLRHVKSYQYLAAPPGSSPFDKPIQDYEGGDIFDHSFVEVEYYLSGSLDSRHYLAHPTLSDLASHYITNYPGGAQIIYQIYDVFDSRLNINRIIGQNALYGSLRGRNAYYHVTEHQNYGIAGGFHTGPWSSPYDDFGVYLMQQFWGIDASHADAVEDNELVIWQTNARYTLYHQPKIGASIHSGLKNKRVYNSFDDEFRIANGVSMNVGQPKLFYHSHGSSARQLVDMTDIKGSRFFYNKVCGIMIYPLRSDSGNYYSFLVKPLGITTISIKSLNVTTSLRTISEAVYKNARMVKMKLLSVPAIPDIFSGHYPIWDSFHYSYYGTSGKYYAGGDKDTIPDYVKFYRKDLVNGVRSEYHDGILKIHKHKNNAMYSMTITRKRG